jgi:predicted CoA-binding protein
MATIKEAAAAFLANKRIAVTGVSRTAKGHASNLVYKRLRDRGYEVFAVNPNAEEVEGDRCYHRSSRHSGRRGGGRPGHEA